MRQFLDRRASDAVPDGQLPSDVLLRAEDVAKHFDVFKKGVLRRRTAQVRAVDGVSLTVRAGQTLGIVGESGCGKSTLGRCLIRLVDLTAGRITFEGRDISSASQAELRPLRGRMQMVFQDPFSSLNPRKPVETILTDPLRAHGQRGSRQLRDQAKDLLDLVGLAPDHLRRYPHEFSGGQRQRIAVARALALKPRLIVADEPVSALDVSVQAQVVNLFHDLQTQLGLAYVFIAHDLAIVRHVSHQLAVMYLGQIVEYGDAAALCAAPAHPYTEALLSAAPSPDVDSARRRERIILTGDPPSALNPPPGCRFHSRCPYADQICREQPPVLRVDEPDGRLIACHHPLSG